MDTEKTRRGRPRKSSAQTKSESILLRLEPREKLAFASAADAAGVPLSVWIRERLRRAARRELEEAGLKIAFLDYSNGRPEQ
jgi:predicted HicB family RNase H-like nuclease